MGIRTGLIVVSMASIWTVMVCAAEDPKAATASGDVLSQEEIIQRVKAQHPGTITEIELEHEHGRPVYEVDIVDEDGKKRELKLDAKTGDVISSETDDDEDDDEDD